MADINIEETNRIRVALGMQPLPVPGAAPAGPVFKDSKDADSDDEPASTLERRQAAAGENWQKVQDEADAKAKRQAQKEAIRKAREKAQRFAKLEGKGLGDSDEEAELDTRTWLTQQKKRQKKIEKARKLADELAAREKELELQAQYTEADLAGVKVGHELDHFDTGEQILTLKDAAIDDEDEEDELENMDMREKEKLQEKLESKKRKPAYNPMDDDGSGEKKILEQYDEEIEGKKRKRFTLDGQGNTKKRATSMQGDSGKPKGVQISLDLLKEDAPISDYQDAPEVKIKVKKSKKKTSKTTRKRALDNEDTLPSNGTMDTSMDIDDPVLRTNSINKFSETNFHDDEDLQADLAAQRRAALKKRKKIRPEDVVKQLREEASTPLEASQPEERAEDDEPGLVLDETSEFVAGLGRPPVSQRKPRSPSIPHRTPSPASDEDGDVQMQEASHDVSEDATANQAESAQPDITTTGLEDEGTLDTGLGGTLGMLRQRGLLKDSTNDMNAIYRDRQRFLAEKHKREEDAESKAKKQRERDRTSGITARMTPREREEHARRNNTQRDQQESRQLAEMFNKEYKPNVELKYVDEHGRHMGAKEAFKHLSHQFHGKGSGKGKTEKRLKKIQDEQKREAMSTLDSSQHTGMHNAQAATSRNKGQAGVRLQ